MWSFICIFWAPAAYAAYSCGFPTVVGRVHPMSASLGPSHKLPVCPQTKRKITPKPSKDPRQSWDAQEPGNLSGCCLAYDGQKDVGEQRAKDVRFILGKIQKRLRQETRDVIPQAATQSCLETACAFHLSGFRPQKRSSHFNSIMAAYCLSYFAHLLVQHL